MANTIYSHAFLVGSLNGDIKFQQLEKDKRWIKEIISLDGSTPRYERDKGYNGLCTLYYKAHLDAMLEAENVIRPDFLCTVHHYIHNLGKTGKESVPNNEIVLPLKKGKYPILIPFDYSFRLCRLHLFFFPLDIVLFAIEIDDTGTELDNLTAAHSSLMGYWDADSFNNEVLSELMKPLTEYLNTTNGNRLTKDGNKLKLFQTIKIGTSSIKDDLLYELGTSSPIGCVKGGKRPDMKPAESYFNKIMEENSVATFDNWKGLALVDSFTMLGKEDSFDKNDCNYLYFPLIYLRCIFEKTFCFSRNNAYREDKHNRNLSREILMMEKYYFYDDISYNFQPNLLYKAMVKGLGLKEEREELSKQIKEKDEKNRDIILAMVSGFAIFSIVFDLYSIIIAAMGVPNEGIYWLAQLLIIIGLSISIILGYVFYSHRRI